MRNLTDTMRQNMHEWLLDSIYDYLSTSDGEPISAVDLQSVLFDFINEDFELVRSQFGQIPIGEIDEIIHDVIQVIDSNGHLRKDSRYTYQGLDECGEPCFINTNDYQEAKRNYVWGTYGKGGNDPLKWKKLVDCTDEHLQAILNTQKQINMFTYEVIKDILKERETKITLDEELFTL